MSESATMVPLRGGMYQMPADIDGTPRLYGQRCTSCGEQFTSTDREYCANCGEAAMEQMLLGAKGQVHTYTVVHQQLSGSLMTPPYVIARVLLDDGLSVQTVLCDVAPEDVRIGLPVEICLKEVEKNEEGQAVVNFFFRPA